ATKETSFISFGTMGIAIAIIFAWLNFVSSGSDGPKNRRTGLVALGIGILVLAVYFHNDLAIGLKGFYDQYIANAWRREQPLIFVGILVLLVTSIELGRRALSIPRERQGRDESDRESLGLSSFIARLRNLENSSLLTYGSVLLFAYVGILFFSSF